MKKLFLLLACVAMSVLAMGQNNQLVWANGRLLYGTPVAGMDSLTYDEMQDIDTLHLLLPRTLIKVVHDTVYIHDTVYVETDCGENIPSAGIGVFSVSADKQVTFSKGNLQYHPANDEWRFAENQTDYIGDANSNCSSTYDGWLDLFGWSTSATNFGVSTSTDWENDYLGSFVDWGTNKIGNDAPDTWRTLSNDEWDYLRYNRTNANDLIGVAQVNGANGLILLPDNWTCPAGVTFKSGFHSEYSVEYGQYQTFSVEQWSKLESAGAVFLPAAGFRFGSNVLSVRYDGLYWSATEDNSGYAYFLYFDSVDAGMEGNGRNYGRSVRLVKDIEGGGATPDTPDTPTEPEEPTNPSAGIGTFSVSADKQVTFSKGNLQYTRSTDTWSFAVNQYDYIGTDNVTGGDVEPDPTFIYVKYGDALADKVDLFGWSTSATNFGVSASQLSNDYSGSFVDWGTNQIGNDAPNTWRTLSKDEWMYIFYNRPNAQSLFALGSVNGVNGTIILPDNWTTPDGVSFVASTTQGLSWDGSYYYNSNGNNFSHNTYTAEQWQTMEQAGAVFLPASGERWGTDVIRVGYDGDYWSSTEYLEAYAYHVGFSSGYLNPLISNPRDEGHSVRLVKDL